MSSLAPQTKAVLDLVRSILFQGPSHPAYDGLRVFDHPKRMLAFLTGKGEEITPVTVEMWPSLSCNARCPTCPYRLSGARDYADSVDQLQLLNPTLGREIILGASAAGVSSVIFTGGGEPLLHPEIVSFASEAVHAGLAWAMFTNGLLLHPPVARKLLSYGPRFLRVSLDAGSPEQYSHIYSVPPEQFSVVSANILSAAKIARELHIRGFGMGFTLEPQINAKELRAIRHFIEHLFEEAEGGIGLVAFRPRVIHYKSGKPLCPQPSAASYLGLANDIKSEIIQPLQSSAARIGARLDIKEGLFQCASQSALQNFSFGSSWMTNIDHEGIGYITAELAGTRDSRQRWGRVLSRADFLQEWAGPKRKELYEKLKTGRIHVPLAHRTSPLDAALLSIRQTLDPDIDLNSAIELLRCVRALQPSRSNNGDFV